MNGKEAVKIIKTYKYYKDIEDATDLKCINPDYLEAKRKYKEAEDKIEKDLELLETLKRKFYASKDETEKTA